MHYLAKSSLALALCLNGCSMFSSGQQQDSNAIKPVAELKLPNGLQQPAKPGIYDIPVSSKPGVVINERSPVLVLATAASSRVEEGEKQAKVRFDRTDTTGDLVPFLQQVLGKQFDEQNVILTAVDAGEADSSLIYTTDWISAYEEQGFWLWTSNNIIERSRFTISIETKPHGRSATLAVKMLEHEYFNSKAKLKATDSHRQEVALLNSIIDRIDKEEIILTKQNRTKMPDVTLESGLDKSGNAALVTAQTVDVTWSQLEQLFEALNLKVTDKDRSKHTYFLRYEKEKRGFWSSLWSSSTTPELPISKGEYQLLLTKIATGTAITLRDKEGTLLSPETMLSLHKPFVEAIRMTKIEL